MEFLSHEMQYRSVAVMHRLRDARVTVCGAGALGANVAESLARQGVGHLVLIDRDRVEEGNLCTQPFTRSDVGSSKARVLAHAVTRAVDVAVTPHSVELGAINARKLLKGADLVLDVFDNTASRALVQRACAELKLPCLHGGISADYAEVIWDPLYKVPNDTGLDPCNYPLARNLVLLTVAVLAESVVEFLAHDTRHSRTITLRDFGIRSLAGA